MIRDLKPARRRPRPRRTSGCANHHQRAFSLLELLVVVAIIALLVAILLPSLKRARDQSRRVACQANLKQIAAAWHMYLDSSKGQFLRGINMEYNYGGLQGKGSEFFGSNRAYPIRKPLNRCLNRDPVLRTGSDVFGCPSDKGTRFIGPTAIEYYGTSYYPNLILIGQSALWVPYGDPCEAVWNRLIERMGGLTLSQIKDPASVMLIGDFAWLDNWDLSVPEDFPYWHERRSYHNIAFLDGRAEFIPIRKAIHVDPRYTLIPYQDLRRQMEECQQEIRCP